MTTRKRLINQLDRVFSRYIRLRDGACVICGSRENLNAGHIITRSVYSVRWDEENVWAQCRGCNFLHEHRPEIFITWFINRFGRKKWEALLRRSRTLKKWQNYELTEMIQHYKEKIKELEGKDEKNGVVVV